MNSLLRSSFGKVFSSNTSNLTRLSTITSIFKLTCRSMINVHSFKNQSSFKLYKVHKKAFSDIQENQPVSEVGAEVDDQEPIARGLTSTNVPTDKEGINKLYQVPIRKAVTTGICPKLLSELIGTKYYSYNDEIKLSLDRIVACYDESGKLIGNKTLSDAYYYANSQNKDVVLRNEKGDLPIVKIVNYKIDLVKRLIQKFTKDTTTEQLKGFSKSTKTLFLSYDMQIADFEMKLEKAKDLLGEATTLKLVIPINLEDKVKVVKATAALQQFANKLAEYGKVTQKPQTRKHTETQSAYNLDNMNDLKFQEDLESEIFNAQLKYEKKEYSEKDLDKLDVVELNVESLVIDRSGINYEKLLESLNIEELSKGVKAGNIDNMFILKNIDKESSTESHETEKTAEDPINKPKQQDSREEKAGKIKKKIELLNREIESGGQGVKSKMELRNDLIFEFENEKFMILLKRMRKDFYATSKMIYAYQTLKAGSEELKADELGAKKESKGKGKKEGKGKKDDKGKKKK